MILPFPGGVVRSGSKVGARGYKGMIASTNDAYCPTLRPLTASALPDGVNSVLEIVLDGLSPDAIRRAMRAGIDAACRPRRPRDLRRATTAASSGRITFTCARS